MMQHFTIEHIATSRAPITDRALNIALTFGINTDLERRQAIIDETDIPVPLPRLPEPDATSASGGPGGIVFITGPSGGGKSTILNRLAEACADNGWHVVRLDDRLHLPERPVIDLIDLPRDDAIRLLALAGLADAFIMLRTGSELSEGQRWRVHLAMAMRDASRARTGSVLIADEFCSALDRVSAMTIARNVRRWIDRSGHTLVCATAHDDVLEALSPEVLVYKDLGTQVEVVSKHRHRS